MVFVMQYSLLSPLLIPFLTGLQLHLFGEKDLRRTGRNLVLGSTAIFVCVLAVTLLLTVIPIPRDLL